jgi:SAM-dependent methyltransferase
MIERMKLRSLFSRQHDYLVVKGYCQICESETFFRSRDAWLRDHFFCEKCQSIPRERGLLYALKLFYPEWRTLKIHESSPVDRAASLKMRKECPGYLASHFDPKIPFGTMDPDGRYRCEDLEHQTFPAESFDLVVTQDVFEHLFNPDLAIREIARTLRPGGAHIATVPMVMKEQPSRRRARLSDGKVIHELPPEYHGNPISADGSLVTFDWGFDLADYLGEASGLSMKLLFIDDLHLGLRAQYLEVLVCRKPGVKSEAL